MKRLIARFYAPWLFASCLFAALLIGA